MDRTGVRNPVTLIMMRGYPATGKSTIARAIASALQVPFLDRDVICQVGVDILGTVPEIGRLSYELLFALAREQLALGLGVIVDTPLTYRVTYERALQMAQELHVPLLVVHCRCSLELQRKRLEERKGKVSTFQITSWEEWQRWQPLFEEFDDNGCVLDTAQPLLDSLTKVFHALSASHERFQRSVGEYNVSR
jgi:predicted kinase